MFNYFKFTLKKKNKKRKNRYKIAYVRWTIITKNDKNRSFTGFSLSAAVIYDDIPDGRLQLGSTQCVPAYTSISFYDVLQTPYSGPFFRTRRWPLIYLTHTGRSRKEKEYHRTCLPSRRHLREPADRCRRRGLSPHIITFSTALHTIMPFTFQIIFYCTLYIIIIVRVTRTEDISKDDVFRRVYLPFASDQSVCFVTTL